MKRISKAVEKKDHKIKTSGRAEYIADKKMAGMLQAAFVRSEIPHGRIVKIELPPLPEGYIDEIHKLSAEYGKWLRCTTLEKEDK